MKNCGLKKINKKINSKNILINSKEIKKNDIFGLKGKSNDGSKFADEAIKKGAAFCIVNSNKNRNAKKIKVNNPLKTLTEVAQKLKGSYKLDNHINNRQFWKNFIKRVIGFCFQYKLSPTSYSKYSYNNKFGVPLSLLNIKKNINFLYLK